MRQVILGLTLVAAAGLSGCVSVGGPTPPAGCEGGPRRALNRSMWDWEGARGVAAAPDPAVTGGPAPEEPAPAAPQPDPARGSRARAGTKGRASLAPVATGSERHAYASRASTGAASQACLGEAGHG